MKPFSVARSRLNRAKTHSEALAELWNSIPAEEVFGVRAKITPDGRGTIRLTRVKPIAEEFSLLLGEMFYQLRSALDACIYQAMVYATGQNPPPKESQLEFPITSDASGF
jgi:hypothetical protein